MTTPNEKPTPAPAQEMVDTAYALLMRELDAYRDKLKLFAERGELLARRDENRLSLSEEAYRKGKELWLRDRAIEIQKLLDEKNREIAKRVLP